MTSNAVSTFVYVTYIRTTPEKLWDALLKPEFTTKYWFGIRQESDWTKGSPWKLTFPDGRVADSGEVIEIERPRRLMLKWRHELMPELREEGYSRCTMQMEETDGSVKLTITHEIDRPDAEFIRAVSGGWPKILSSLKSLLETGEALPRTDRLPDD
jgi:uncharacterized protein YndB with AHSA1/START domain